MANESRGARRDDRKILKTRPALARTAPSPLLKKYSTGACAWVWESGTKGDRSERKRCEWLTALLSVGGC